MKQILLTTTAAARFLPMFEWMRRCEIAESRGDVWPRLPIIFVPKVLDLSAPNEMTIPAEHAAALLAG